jgi:hypothetical protein
MNIDAIRRATLLAVCLVSVGCQRKIAEKETPPFRIIATDAGFEAPDGVAAGLRHIVFENRGSEIHEAIARQAPEGHERERLHSGREDGIPVPGRCLGLLRPRTNIAWRDRRDVVKGGPGALHHHLLEWRSRQDYSRPPL